MNLNQITVPSADLNISVPFYQKLGLKLIVSALPKYARFECPDGNSSFSLHFVEEIPEPGIWVYFECEDLDMHVQMLISAGIVFDELPEDQPWLWREARLKDPDGNRIILYHAGLNRLYPPWRIDQDF
ncbi:VOC family protein [Robertkochia solimangrovi]|uniref:VOC family protein n=1 Tax=Robertkochia solimangrovi TaxID=2213046 RepID=UPI00117E7FA7|nr:VOC family protein [Robertkochia solimangrovi]TRZ45888.1 VOC family protein [Robertkochia solimangrovi]